MKNYDFFFGKKNYKSLCKIVLFGSLSFILVVLTSLQLHANCDCSIDSEAPFFVREAKNKTILCTDDRSGEFQDWLDLYGGALAVDAHDCNVNWSTNPTDPMTTFDPNNKECDSISVHFIVTDDCGNKDSVNAMFTIAQIGFIEHPRDTTIQCDNRTTDYEPEFNQWLSYNAGIILAEECNADASISHQVIGEGDQCHGFLRIVRFRVTDANCNNYTIWSDANFQVSDKTSPTFLTEAQDTIIECDKNGDMQAVFQNWLNNRGGATAEDDCGDVYWAHTVVEFDELCTAGDATGFSRVSFIALDECGNPSYSTASFTITDNTAPELHGVPNDTTVQCGSVPPPANVIATDNCSSNLDIEFTETRTDGSCPNQYTIKRSWSTRDICGRTAYQEQEITVIDTQPPSFVINPPVQNIFIECMEDVPPAPTVYAADNCGPQILASLSESTTMVGNCKVQITRTWTATDLCGHSRNYIQNIHIEDTTPPTLVGVPNDLTVSNQDDVPDPAPVSATDNCDDNLVVDFDEQTTAGSNCDAVITRTWTTTDVCGNTTTDTQTITVTDTEAPMMNCDAADRLFCDGETVTFDTPTANDACSNGGGITVTQTSGPASGSTFPIGTTEVCFEAADQSGNTTGCCFNVIVTALPVLTLDNNACDPANDLVYEFTLTNGDANATYDLSANFDGSGVAINPTSGSVGTTFSINLGADAPTGTDLAIDITTASGCDASFTFAVDVACCIAIAGEVNVAPVCAGDDIVADAMNPDGSASFQQDPDYDLLYLLVDDGGVIVGVNTNGVFAGFGAGTYEVYTLSVYVDNNSNFASNIMENEPFSQLQSMIPTDCFEVSVPAQLIMPKDMLVLQGANVSEGNNGGTTPFFFNHHIIEISGGTPPYTYDWDRQGYVRSTISTNYDEPGATVDIVYSDNAVWSLTVTDANGCITEDWEFSNVANNASNGILEIADFQVSGASSANSLNGSISLTIAGGCPPYEYVCNGPHQAQVQGTHSNPNAPIVLDGLKYGWYFVEITDAGGTTCPNDAQQTTRGWYWVPYQVIQTTNGFVRGKTDELALTDMIRTEPNPFQNGVSIVFNVAEDSYGRVDIFDATGKLVKNIYEGQFNGGQLQSIEYQGKDLVNGIYFVQLTTDKGINVTKKIVKVLAD